MARPIQSPADALYEGQIRPLPMRERLRLAQRILAEMEAAPEPRSRSLLELEGLGAELWKSVDAQTIVDEMRGEWDSRP